VIGARSRYWRVASAKEAVSEDGYRSPLPLVNRFRDIAMDSRASLLEDNADWYRQYHSDIAKASEGFIIIPSVAVAAVAAMSPGMAPDAGLYAFQRVCEHVLQGKDLPPIRSFKQNVKLAIEIVRHKDISLLKGQKVRDFYHSIYHNGESDRAPIDRWAAREFPKYQKVKGKWPDVDLNKSEYQKMQDQFRKAADKLGLYPAELQAILWVHRRGNG
jgi:hypothetical protein